MRERDVKAGAAARALSLLALLVLSCGRAAAATGPFNVVIVLWDAARYDHTTPGGYSRDTTPNLAAFAEQGAFFTKAFSQSNWTMTAVASLFTGRRASSHGVLNPGDRLPERLTTLAEAFKERGFSTAAFTSGVIRGGSGFESGFDTMRSIRAQTQALGSIREPQEEALAWLKERSREPFFIYVHGADAHYPYACPPERRLLFSDKDYEGPAKDLKVDRNFVAAYDRSIEADFLRAVTLPDWDRTQAVKSAPADLAYLVAQYDGCLSYADSLLPRLTGALTELGLAENTAVIVLSDHGEALGGHGGYGHLYRPLHDEVSRIVLAARLPGLPPGRRIDAPVEIIDLLPTLLELQNWPAPAGVEGRSLAGLLRGGPPPPEPALWSASAQSSGGPRRIGLQALRYGEWKALRDQDGWKLFDLKSDPGETRDRLHSQPEVFVGLAARLLSLGLTAAGSPDAWMKPEAEALSARALRDSEKQALSDEPGRERRLLELASGYERQGDFDSAARVCLSGLAASPREQGFSEILARAYLKGGRLTELAALRRKQSGGEAGAPLPHILELAGALVKAGRYEEAETVLRRADSSGRVPGEREVLRDKLALAGKLKASAGKPPMNRAAGTNFERTTSGWTVSRPPWVLKYAAAGGEFSLERDGRPAAGTRGMEIAAGLAGLLLDHVEELRFASGPAPGAIPAGLKEKLQAAGYLPAD